MSDPIHYIVQYEGNSPIQKTIVEAQCQALEIAAQEIESLRQMQVPEILRGCDFFGNREHEDGWVDFNSDEVKLNQAIARMIRTQIANLKAGMPQVIVKADTEATS